MKAAPVMRVLAGRTDVEQALVHTGQHYDDNMSDVFFRQLDLPAPDVNLEVGSGSQAWQTAQIMMRFEEVVLKRFPDWVLVYGDVNSTLAAALVCVKLGILVGHIEAGLRSFDRSMPEEINRLLTDQVADLLFTPSEDGDRNLLREGVAAEKIHRVGNVMIDTLMRLLPRAERRGILERFGFSPGEYGLVTLHRPSNVDDAGMLEQILEALQELSLRLPLLFSVHPRTKARIASFLGEVANSQLMLTEPIAYLDFLALQRRARLVITDSGGIQEETTYLGIPCITVRENTERPVTVELGTNIVVGRNTERLLQEAVNILNGQTRHCKVPPLWDGRASERIGEVLVKNGGLN